jgi:hypothetical protein
MQGTGVWMLIASPPLKTCAIHVINHIFGRAPCSVLTEQGRVVLQAKPE